MMYWSMNKTNDPIIPHPRLQASWIPPSVGWLFLNFDGDSKGNLGPVESSGVARDHRGRVIMIIDQPLR